MPNSNRAILQGLPVSRSFFTSLEKVRVNVDDVNTIWATRSISATQNHVVDTPLILSFYFDLVRSDHPAARGGVAENTGAFKGTNRLETIYKHSISGLPLYGEPDGAIKLRDFISN